MKPIACWSLICALPALALAAQEQSALIDGAQPLGGWSFLNGPEFPGAKGELALLPDAAGDGQPGLKLSGDFTGGGNYVQATREVKSAGAERLSFKLKAPGTTKLTIRLIDDSKQCHQIDLKFEPRDDWRVIDFPLAEFFKRMGTSAAVPNVSRYEKWGGKNDGKFHAPARAMGILVSKHTKPNDLKPVIELSGIRLLGAASAFAEDFESAAALPQGWSAKGAVSVDAEGAHQGKHALKLSRALENLQDETGTVAAAFTAAPGLWSIRGAARTELNSPDSSYNLTVGLEALKAGGGVLETLAVHEPFGKTGWAAFEKKVELPAGTAAARLTLRLNKADGAAWVDELSVAPVAQDYEKHVERIVVSSERLGHLFLPDDKPVFQVQVETVRALREPEARLSFAVLDYWGAEQAASAETKLIEKQKTGQNVTYTAEVDLSGLTLETGRYYELHLGVPREKGPEETEYAGFAKLPEAVTAKHKPEDLPFTIRNWDNRVPDYLRLSARLGIRTIGLWCGWDSKAPYKPNAPCLDLCQELGARWISTTPAASVERVGFKEYDETALREGMRNFLKTFGDKKPYLIALGNEPHGKLEKVKENVRAYQILYEAIKAHDPNIFVIGTSVEPNEDYFNLGYYKYLDAYDFHIYEHHTNVRKTMQAYKKLMEQHQAVKPLYSTELGLNSQGQPRHDVAVSLVKKLAVFFAEGGANVSWFTINYPDPKGKARGSSGDSHCVFDCKYSKYNPRLDAVMYYWMVNGIEVKKFAQERVYADGTEAYLFRDAEGNCLQILWNEKAAPVVALGLPGVDRAELIRIDGSRAELKPWDGKLNVGVSNEPVLLRYLQKDGALAETLGEPAFKVAPPPKSLAKGRTHAFVLEGAKLTPAQFRAIAPPLWKTALSTKEGGGVECRLEIPADTRAREARITLQYIPAEGAAAGEATLTLPLGGP
ncbi:MAG: hypothetical protein HS116_14295 [Planctomycetes bacterium]|nr:hypothetical protein [Planctomycetota bacterium]